ncbi:Six-hairpin glycosidase-like protein [Penicillium macrosclerotiorum]|uniref:Six-hairpin glycosidase-like protein n=1 Tax=Penicillium macrosclerotiorum TaxID=303699 RepID=UPI0025474D81|nr:Six-hairpin glycosidase-like protein [Penicillium macrosclerotiorum]KAJ5692989.1 Six-hairpin glycosidase-like protein [Penicillium macrosclerotiorum]
MASRKDTHDLGFIVQPALQRDWELFGRQKSLDALLSAADSLASRYDDRVGAIRSWNRFSNAHHDIENMEEDFIVIIDNLDLLFYAANYTRSTRLLSIGKTHATTLLTTHLRKESVPNRETCYSTYHAVNFCPANKGHLKRKFTAQGYSDNSTWARGQAWAILGYAQTFSWTKQEVFLQTAMGLADYFIYRMELSPKVIEASGHGRYVPLWDFDAPITFTTVKGIQTPLRDVSAGLIAANGMIILYGQLLSLGRPECARRYLEYALAIANDTIALAYNREQVCLSFDKKSETIRVVSSGESEGRLFDSILERSTANFNEDHADRHWDHGLVYADYYFLELGNRLLDMGLAL